MIISSLIGLLFLIIYCLMFHLSTHYHYISDNIHVWTYVHSERMPISFYSFLPIIIDYRRNSFFPEHTTKDRFARICIGAKNASFVRISWHLTAFFYTCDSRWWSQKFWSIHWLPHEYIHKPGTRVRDKDVNCDSGNIFLL